MSKYFRLLLLLAIVLGVAGPAVYRKFYLNRLAQHGRTVSASDLQAVTDAVMQIGPAGNLDHLAMADHPLKKYHFDPSVLEVLVAPSRKAYQIQIYGSPHLPKSWTTLGTVDGVTITKIPGTKIAIGEKTFKVMVGTNAVGIIFKWLIDPEVPIPVT